MAHASDFTRRSLLALSGGGAAALAACSSPQGVPFTKSSAPAPGGAFRHGIASGDPAADSVVLWTRVTPDGEEAVEVACEIATRPDFSDARTLSAAATPARDWCVHVVPTALAPGTTYHYRFRAGSEVSPAGTTRTLPQGATPSLRLAVVSCSNWEHGWFHAYDHIARRHDEAPFDALLHLGDYYYEYGSGAYGGAETVEDVAGVEDADAPVDAVVEAAVEGDALGELDGMAGDEPPLVPAPDAPLRAHEPPHEIVTLADYRTRHAQYRTDPDLQAATARMPLIPIWDDHETANDSWRTGAENHQPPTEGPWEDRKRAALRAYYDWMPVREPSDPATFWRSYSFGDLATLTCVETRLSARSEPIIIEDHVERITGGDAEQWFADVLGDASREMLGARQRDFIVDGFRASKAAGQPWRVLANQVIMARLLTPDLTPYVDPEAVERIAKDWEGVRDFVALSRYRVPFYPDSWDGYPAARERLFAALDDAGVNDMVVLTGDAHEFWASRLTREDGTRMGAEFVTSSVSSKTLEAYLGDNTPDFSLLMTRENDDPRFYDALHNGWTEVELGRGSGRVTMWAIPDVRSRSYEAVRLARFTVRPGRKGGRDTVRIRSPRGLNLKQRLLFSGLG